MKSAVIPATILVMALSGCVNAPLTDMVLDDGPAPGPSRAAPAGSDPQAVLTGERPIRRAQGGGLPWPHLGSVPPRPGQFTTPAERQALLDRLQSDRAEAQDLSRQMDTGPGTGGPTPGAVPEPRVPAAPPPIPSSPKR